MAPPANVPHQQPRSYHHRFGQLRKRQRLPSSDSQPATPRKKSREPLGEIDSRATNRSRDSAQSPDKSDKVGNKDFDDAIQPFAGVPSWLLEDCLKPSQDVGSLSHDNSGQGLADTKAPRICLDNVDLDGAGIQERVAGGGNTNLEDVAVDHNPVPSEGQLGINVEDTHSISGACGSVEDEDLQTRLQALPAHTVRSLIYDMAVTDETGELETNLAEAEAAQDVPSAIFGYQYCSMESIVAISSPETAPSQSPAHEKDDVEDAQHMLEELLLDIVGQTSTDSPYSTKRAALVATLRVFEVIFGFRSEGNRIAKEMPADVEVNWASLFDEVFDTLATFEKRRLATAMNGVFLKKMGSTVSSVARADLGCAGMEWGVLATLTRALINLNQHGESARRLEELEMASAMG